MPELPELTVWARQADQELTGKTIAAVETPQPKCLNVAPEEIAALVVGRTVKGASERGKWMIIDLAAPAGLSGAAASAARAGSGGDSHLLLNLGMGGDFYYHPAPAGEPARAPEKYQFKLSFTDGSELALRFWWFGYTHAVKAGELARHEMTASLGPSPLDPDMDLARFEAMVAARPRRSAKSFLLDQKILAGIGNVYAQDSLWGAGLHPDRPLGTLSKAEVKAFWLSIRRVLEQSIAKGGLAFERDFFGRSGGLANEDFAVGYKPGRPCPKCGTVIEKIKTGSTSTYICPSCQKV